MWKLSHHPTQAFFSVDSEISRGLSLRTSQNYRNLGGRNEKQSNKVPGMSGKSIIHWFLSEKMPEIVSAASNNLIFPSIMKLLFLCALVYFPPWKGFYHGHECCQVLVGIYGDNSFWRELHFEKILTEKRKMRWNFWIKTRIGALKNILTWPL